MGLRLNKFICLQISYPIIWCLIWRAFFCYTEALNVEQYKMWERMVPLMVCLGRRIHFFFLKVYANIRSFGRNICEYGGKKRLTKSNAKTMKLIQFKLNRKWTLSFSFAAKKDEEDLIRYVYTLEFEFPNCFEIVVMCSIRFFLLSFHFFLLHTKSFMATSIETGKFNKQILPEYALHHG